MRRTGISTKSRAIQKLGFGEVARAMSVTTGPNFATKPYSGEILKTGAVFWNLFTQKALPPIRHLHTHWQNAVDDTT